MSVCLLKVESFILDQEDLDNPIMKTASELLLSSATDGVDLRTVDPETQARLEALLEAAGMTASSVLHLGSFETRRNRYPNGHACFCFSQH